VDRAIRVPAKSMSSALLLPVEFKKYFWDCDFSRLTVKEYPFFITERILRFGNMGSLQWLLDVVGLETVKQVVTGSRNLDKKTINFWTLMLHG
jgi:hypothetical protein